jgi:hypothetical protein
MREDIRAELGFLVKGGEGRAINFPGSVESGFAVSNSVIVSRGVLASFSLCVGSK